MVDIITNILNAVAGYEEFFIYMLCMAAGYGIRDFRDIGKAIK